MPSLDDLPVELVLKILKGSSLQDILNVTLTSTFFRALGCSSRSLWMDAQGSERIPLPMGETLDSVSLSSISGLAAYAVAMSTVWRGKVARPRRISHIMPYPPRRPILRIFDHSTILPGNQWILADMHTDSPRVSCIKTGESLPLIVEGSVLRYAYESSNNGSSITLAVVKRAQGAFFLDVYILQFDAQREFRTVPHVRRALSICIIAAGHHNNPPTHVDLKGSLVVVSSENELFTVNWRERSGVKLSPYPHLPPGEEQNEFLNGPFFLKAVFHPELHLLIAEKVERWVTSTHAINFPTVLTPFDTTDLTDKGLIWPTELLVSTHLHTLGPREYLQYMNLCRRRSGPLIDLVYTMRSGFQDDSEDWEDLYHLSISPFGESTQETTRCRVDFRHSLFTRRTTTGRAILLGMHESADDLARQRLSTGNNPVTFATTRIRKWMASSFNLLSKLILNRPVRKPSWLFFLHMPDGSGQEPSWVHLEFPNGVLGHRLWQLSVLAFDDVYGTLLLSDENGKYCVVQY